LIRIKSFGKFGASLAARFVEDGKMRLAALLPMLFLLPGMAAAQTPECRTVPKATDRLACYDKAAPPRALENSAATKAAAGARTGNPAQKQVPADQQAPLADILEVENSRLDAKIKNICRGC
jgi:hypothetical protein